MSTQPHRKLIVLGSTGSIGVNTLQVAAHLNRCGAAHIDVVGLAAGGSAKPLIEQAKRFGVRQVAIADGRREDAVRQALPEAAVFAGPDAAKKLVQESDATDAVVAVVGAAALPATLAAIDAGMAIALANKETLVAGGALVTARLRERGVRLIPIDSEHSAIFQCLDGVSGFGSRVSGVGGAGASRDTPPAARRPQSVRRIVLTASGGPFRNCDKATIDSATPEQALNHPTWEMGPKITVDSASMMNKALEIIEAHWLFGLPGQRIEVIVHPQSIVHSFVEFVDHSILAQLGPPDMRTPIQYALTYPDRPPGCSTAMDWSTLSQLTFEPPDAQRFPSLGLAHDVVEAGGTAGAVFNAANEAAVEAFLARRVRFGRVFELVAEALGQVPVEPVDCLQTVQEADRRAREFVNLRIRALIEQ